MLPTLLLAHKPYWLQIARNSPNGMADWKIFNGNFDYTLFILRNIMKKKIQSKYSDAPQSLLSIKKKKKIVSKATIIKWLTKVEYKLKRNYCHWKLYSKNFTNIVCSQQCWPKTSARDVKTFVYFAQWRNCIESKWRVIALPIIYMQILKPVDRF